MVERHDFTIESEPGIDLFVREVRDTPSPGGVPVVLVHGARVSGIASFDLAVPGGSVAEDLALAGHRVFVMDARGYGRSTRPAEMNGDPADCPPLVRSSEVVRDLAGVVRAVRDRTGAAQIALLGWATGGMWVGHYATLYPDTVSHLVLYNALYGGTRGIHRSGRAPISRIRCTPAASTPRRRRLPAQQRRPTARLLGCDHPNGPAGRLARSRRGRGLRRSCTRER